MHVKIDPESSTFCFSSSLTVSWVGFIDAQTGIADFWWCVGKTPEACDVIPITHTMLSRGTLTSGLALPVATPLYVTVRPRNPGGLQTLSVSDCFQGVFLNLPLLKQVERERERGGGTDRQTGRQAGRDRDRQTD